MDSLNLQTVCNWIILIGSVLLAFERIYSNLIKKPGEKLNKKQEDFFNQHFDKRLESSLPPLLAEHGELMRAQRAVEYQELLGDVEKIIEEKTSPYLEELERINIEQNEQMKILTESSKDMLRDKIMDIYARSKAKKVLTYHDKESLEQYYKDYKAEKGNSYIDKYYKRMCTYEVEEDSEN